MYFRVRVHNLEPVLNWLRKVTTTFRSKALWGLVASHLRTQILVRTAMGQDANGKRFAPYSQSYKLFRQKHGRPVNRVNLFWSGTMLSSMDYAATDHGVRLFFQPTEAPPYPSSIEGQPPVPSESSPVKAYLLQTHPRKPREFFGISRSDVRGIVQTILTRFDTVMGVSE